MTLRRIRTNPLARPFVGRAQSSAAFGHVPADVKATQMRAAFHAFMKGRMIMLSGYKTYIAGALTILGALGGFLTGNLAVDQAINLVVPAILAMTVRHGVSTTAAVS